MILHGKGVWQRNLAHVIRGRGWHGMASRIAETFGITRHIATWMPRVLLLIAATVATLVLASSGVAWLHLRGWSQGPKSAVGTKFNIENFGVQCPIGIYVVLFSRSCAQHFSITYFDFVDTTSAAKRHCWLPCRRPCQGGNPSRAIPTTVEFARCKLTYIPTYLPTCIHIHIFTYSHFHIFTYIHTYIHAYIHTYIHPCTHTYIHTYIQTEREERQRQRQR